MAAKKRHGAIGCFLVTSDFLHGYKSCGFMVRENEFEKMGGSKVKLFGGFDGI